MPKRKKIKIFCNECGELTECVETPGTKVISHKSKSIAEDDYSSSYYSDAFYCIKGHQIKIPNGKTWEIDEYNEIIFRDPDFCPNGCEERFQLYQGMGDDFEKKYKCNSCKLEYTK